MAKINGDAMLKIANRSQWCQWRKWRQFIANGDNNVNGDNGSPMATMNRQWRRLIVYGDNGTPMAIMVMHCRHCCHWRSIRLRDVVNWNYMEPMDCQQRLLHCRQWQSIVAIGNPLSPLAIHFRHFNGKNKWRLFKITNRSQWCHGNNGDNRSPMATMDWQCQQQRQCIDNDNLMNRQWKQ